MSSIIIEDTKLNIEEREEVNSTSIDVKNDRYVVTNEVTRDVLCDCYKYDDFDLFANKQTIYNEKYLNFILYNGETNSGYKLVGISDSLEIQIKRLSETNFVVIGKNADIEEFGQVSFCNLMPSGEVNEIVFNFNKLKQIVFIGKKFVVLNYYEVFDNGGKKEYVYTIAVHRPDGTIAKTLLDKKTVSFVDFVAEVKAGVVTVYKKTKTEKIELESYSTK